MAAVPTCQFSLHIAAVDGDLGGADAVEQFALELRAELADLDVTRIDQVPAGVAPDGTRSAELLLACEFLMTAVQTAAVLPSVIRVIRRCAQRFAQRGRQVRVTVAGVELDPATATDEQLVDTLLGLPTQPAVGVRRALVVANERYDDPRLAQLRSPGHDADALVAVLGDPAIGGFQVDRLVDADERTVRRQIAALFAGSDRDDVLLLHFSCHGVKDQRGRLYLAARDTDLSVLGATGVAASMVADLLSEAQSRRVVLILDCCYSGAFARGAGVRAGSEVHLADEFGAGSGRIVLTASSATEYAFEGGELTESAGQPSAFTGALVNGLRTGEADLDADGEISIDELYDYVYRAVREQTPGQAPMKWSFGAEGSLTIARSVRPAALPPSIRDDLGSDRVVLRLEAVRSLGRLLRDSRPGLRAAALGALAQVRDHDDSFRVRQAADKLLAEAPQSPAAQPLSVPVPPDLATPRVVTPPEPPPPQPVPKVTPRPVSKAARQPVPARPATARAADPAATATATGHPAVTDPAATDTGWQLEIRLPGALAGVAAGLALTGALLYLLGVATGSRLEWFSAMDSSSWPRHHSIAWLAVAAAAGLVLVNDERRWVGVLAGLLSWEGVYASLLWASDLPDDDPEWSWFYLAGNGLLLVAMGCAVAALLRWREPRRPGRLRQMLWAGAVLVLAAVTGGIVFDLADRTVDLDGDVLAAVLPPGLLLCVAVFPLVHLMASGTAARYLPLGWLVGGAQYVLIALTAAGNGYHLDSGELASAVVLMLATAAVMGLAMSPRPVRWGPGAGG